MTYTQTSLATLRSKAGSLLQKTYTEFGLVKTELDALAAAVDTITRSATIVVAASDSSEKSKAQADYVCDGAADNAEIQAALDALPSTGGEIHFTEGTFQLAATVSREINNVTFSGAGRSTFIKYNNSSFIINAGASIGWTFKDIYFDFGWVDISTATKWAFVNVWRKTLAGNLHHIDKWGADSLAPQSKGNLKSDMVNHPLVFLVDDFETDVWALGSYGTLVYDTNIKLTGTRSAKVTTVPGQIVRLRKEYATPIDLTNCAIAFNIRYTDYANVDYFVLQLVTNDLTYTKYGSLQLNAVQTINDTWHSLVFSHTNPTGAADLSQVKAIILQIAPKTSASDIYIDSVVAWKRLLTPRGAVTFTFDDGFQSIHNLVKPAMDVYGYRGVQSYIIGRLTDEDIALAKNLQQTGWDIVNHSYNHDFDQVYREPEFEYGLSQKWLAENGFEGGSQFTLVFGPNPTPKMYKFISENYILARGNKVGFNALPYLPALTYSHYVTNTRTVAAVKAYIDKAVEKGVWINIMFHNIKTSAPLSEYDWLISDLAEVLAYCNSTGIEVLTYSQIADRIRNSKTITLFGSGTITNGTTSVNIRHGFHKAPSSIQVTPTSSLGSAASLWVSSKDTGTGNLFTVSCNTNPGQDITFDWIATL